MGGPVAGDHYAVQAARRQHFPVIGIDGRAGLPGGRCPIGSRPHPILIDIADSRYPHGRYGQQLLQQHHAPDPQSGDRHIDGVLPHLFPPLLFQYPPLTGRQRDPLEHSGLSAAVDNQPHVPAVRRLDDAFPADG